MESFELSFDAVARVRTSYKNIDAGLIEILTTFYERLHFIEPTFSMTSRKLRHYFNVETGHFALG
jgi:hypothetical protein